MAKRVEVKTELTTEELRERYRKASESVERTHWHMVWLMKEGQTPKEVAEQVGYTARWVRTIVGRYNAMRARDKQPSSDVAGSQAFEQDKRMC